MSSNVPPAIRHLEKRDDRMVLLRDVEYFASELIKRVERLARLDSGRVGWQQAAALIRRVRGLARQQTDRARSAGGGTA